MKFWPLFKEYAHQVSVAVALFLILLTGLIVDVRLAMGLPFPDGHDTWLWILAALAGVNVAGMGVLRATGTSYVAAKAAGKAAGPPQVNGAGDANVQTEAPGATAEHAAVVPKAGVKPKDAAIVGALESAARSDPRLPSPLDDERD